MPSATVSAQIPIASWYEINDAVKRGEYESMSDFIRRAVKEKLAKENQR